MRGSSQKHELTTFPGLHPPYSICERQYTRLHCPTSTETPTRLATYLFILHVCPLESSRFPPPRVAPRTFPWRCPRHIRQSRPLGRGLASKAILPRSSSSNNNHTPEFHRPLCLCDPSIRHIQLARQTSESGMVVWQRDHQFPRRGLLPRPLLPRLRMPIYNPTKEEACSRELRPIRRER